jgi:dihydrofolate reductase
MGYVILQLACSLDGYIARKDGSVDFLGEMTGEISKDFDTFVKSIDTIIMGYGTYEKMLEFGDIPFQDKRIYVVTSKNIQSSKNHITFVHTEISELVKEKKGNIWLFGGAKMIQSFINEDLVDEMQIFIINEMIGEGIPLFLENKGMKDLLLTSAKSYDNNVMLIYKRNKSR